MRPTTAIPRSLCAVFTLTALTALTALTSCSSPAEENWNAIATGVDGEVGGVEVRSLLLVASEEGQPARFLGTLVNPGNESVDVVLADGDDSVTVSVPAEGQTPFDTTETVLPSADGRPGSRVPITIEVMGEDEELSVPVLDGTLEQYEPYLPDAA